MKKLILEFLDKYGIKSSEDEDIAITELMMDDHTHVIFDEQGYYLPESNLDFTQDDELILEFLNYTYR